MSIDLDSSTTAPRTVAHRERSEWPTVSVIIPVYDGAALLDACLTALRTQDYPGSVHVVVADNASTDDPGAVVARHDGVCMVHEPRPGSYAARNTALAEVTSEVVAFTDADCRPEPGWLREAVTALRAAPAAAMVGGRVLLSYEGGAPRTGSELYESVHGFPQERYLEDQHFAVTANMVTWRWVIDEVGSFDGSLMSRGDAQWGQRVHAAGLVQRYAPTAVVVHPARVTLGESVTKWRRVAQGKVENDLSAGRGPRHFAGLLAHQGQMLVTVLRTRGSALAGSSRQDRSRYLATAALCRAVTVAVYLGGLRRSLRLDMGVSA